MRYSRQSEVAILLLFQIYGVGGLTIPTTTPLPTPINFNERNNAFTSTLTSTSITSSPPLYLPVKGTQPDPLGISQVSGFYGPGAWATFFISGVTSCKHTFKESFDVYDANTWLFWFMINWASVDIFRITRSINNIPAEPAGEYNAAFIKKMGSLAAAFLVAFWGSTIVAGQIILISVAYEPQRKADRRFWLSLGATIFPLIACIVITVGPFRQAWISDDETAFNHFPALYCSGMTGKQHDLYLGLFLMVLSLILPVALVCLLLWATFELAAMLVQRFPFLRVTVSYLYTRFRRVPILTVCLTLFGVLAYGSFLAFLIKEHPWWLMGVVPGFIAISPSLLAVLPFMWFGLAVRFGSIYPFLMIFSRFKFSQSCFFMPCTTQSIKDEDQMYSLIGGALLFLCLEVLAPLYKMLKERMEWERRQETAFQLNDMLRQTSANTSS